MTELSISLRVDPVEPGNRYAWIIMERTDTEEIELVASLDTYRRPSHAMEAGNKLLTTLTVVSP